MVLNNLCDKFENINNFFECIHDCKIDIVINDEKNLKILINSNEIRKKSLIIRFKSKICDSFSVYFVNICNIITGHVDLSDNPQRLCELNFEFIDFYLNKSTLILLGNELNSDNISYTGNRIYIKFCDISDINIE